MPKLTSRLLGLAFFFVLGCLGTELKAQGTVVNLYPRRVVGEVQEQARTAAIRALNIDSAAADTSRRVDSLVTAAEVELRGWRRVNDQMAAELWGEGRSPLLPGASISPGTDRADVYTELAQEITGGWRLVLGTALAVERGGEDEEEASAEEEASEDASDSGFRRFLAGGGNLSIAAMRPIIMRSRTYDSQVLLFTPRVWTNVPSLSDTDGIEDFGGELAAEWLFYRYARTRRADGSLTDRPETPLVTVALRGGMVIGTNSFYRTIGHSSESFFPYIVPRVNLQFTNGVKFGAAYFYGFGAFSEQERIRLQINLDPGAAPRRSESSK